MSDEIAYKVYTDTKNEHIAELVLWAIPDEGISFMYDGFDVLNLKPGIIKINGQPIYDANKVYESLLAWIKKVESFGKSTNNIPGALIEKIWEAGAESGEAFDPQIYNSIFDICGEYGVEVIRKEGEK